MKCFAILVAVVLLLAGSAVANEDELSSEVPASVRKYANLKGIVVHSVSL